MLTQLSHQELSLLLFALEGAESAPVASPAAEVSCEESCPIVDNIKAATGKAFPAKTS
jgi:hypothetical protein